jgi:hypothetical protein
MSPEIKFHVIETNALELYCEYLGGFPIDLFRVDGRLSLQADAVKKERKSIGLNIEKVEGLLGKLQQRLQRNKDFDSRLSNNPLL